MWRRSRVSLSVVGGYTAVAIYSGDETYSLAQTSGQGLYLTNPAVATNTVVTTPGSSYPQGSAFAFTINVTNQNPSTIPTGGVSVYYNGAKYGYAALNNGVAVINEPTSFTAALPPGTYSLGFTYSGDSAHASSSTSTTINISSSAGATATPALALTNSGSGYVVTMTDAQAGAAIYYTSDGSYPTASSAVYSSPLPLTQPLSLQAIAIAPGFSASAVTTSSFQLPNSVQAGSGFAAENYMTLNGSALINGSTLQLTNDGASQAASAWFSSPVSIQNFSTDFTFQMLDPQDGGAHVHAPGAGNTGHRFARLRAGLRSVRRAGPVCGKQHCFQVRYFQ